MKRKQFGVSVIAFLFLAGPALAETARDTLAWFKSLPQDRQSKLHAGLTPEREAEVLAAWKKQKAVSS